MHKRLEVWKLGIKFANKIYSVTRNFPSDEKFGMISQLRRASVSIPANISEGVARNGDKDKRHFLNMARASACEMETLLVIAKEQGYIDDIEELLCLHSSIKAMLYKLEKCYEKAE